MDIQEKYKALCTRLSELGSVAVAFSGGVDSTFLLDVAHEVLGENAVAVTADSCLIPRRELKDAIDFCEKKHIKQIVFHSKEMEREEFRGNPKNRCYLCKQELFRNILKIAKENQIKYVSEGSNMDDLGDYRPGLQAIKELGIESPLRTAGFTKNEIRELAKERGLSVWNKPSFACLASRFVYGETISEEKLAMVEQAEQLLFELGFRQFRVRMHGMLARIEALPEELERLTEPEVRKKVYTRFSELGFTYVTLDLKGYRTGSMNETLSKA